MKKHFVLVGALILFILALVSCGAGKAGGQGTGAQDPEKETATAIVETDELRPTLPEKNYNGNAFTYLRYDLSDQSITYLVNDLCPEEENGEALNDSLYRRNLTIAEAYNIRLAEVINTNVAAELDQMLRAGDTIYDAVNPDLRRLRTLFINGTLMNLRELPYLDLSHPWWDASSVESLTIFGKLPAVFSDVTLVDKYSTYATLFHKGMAEDYGLPDLYKLTAEGKWTIDQMLALSETVSQDKNGDGIMNRYDVFGIAAQHDAMYILMHGCGAYFADTDADGTPRDAFYTDRTVAIVQKISAMMTDKQRFFNRQSAGLSVDECIDMFAANQALFFLRPLYTVEALRDMENDYGIIPIPKYEESDPAYRCTLNKWVACPIAVPLVVSDAECTGIILEALAAESYSAVLPYFYEDVLGAKIVRDKESADMLDLIFASRMYDIGYIYDFGAFCDKLMKLPGGKDQNIASLYEANKSAIAAEIDTFIEAVK